MDTIHMLGLAGSMVLLWFCAVLLSSERSRELGKIVDGALDSHADGLDAYHNAKAQARKKRKEQQKSAVLRTQAVANVRAQFEGSIQ